MALYTLAPQPWLIFLDDAGLYLPNGQLAIYAAGTSTPVPVYTSATGTAHPFPITLDGAGRVPGGLYLQPGLSYKFVLHAPQIEDPLDGAILKTQDNVAASPSPGGVRQVTTPGTITTLNVSGVSLLEYTGSGDLTIRGLSGGQLGQELLIKNTTNFAILLESLDGTVAPADRLQLLTVGRALLIGPRSVARFVYDSGSRWAMTTFAQGRQYVEPFTAANYGASVGATWTVEGGDLGPETFFVEGRHLFYSFYIQRTTVAGAPVSLSRLLPQGWVSSTEPYAGTMLYTEDAGVTYVEGVVTKLDNAHVSFRKASGASWLPTTNLTGIIGQLAIPLD